MNRCIVTIDSYLIDLNEVRFIQCNYNVAFAKYELHINFGGTAINICRHAEDKTDLDLIYNGLLVLWLDGGDIKKLPSIVTEETNQKLVKPT